MGSVAGMAIAAGSDMAVIVVERDTGAAMAVDSVVAQAVGSTARRLAVSMAAAVDSTAAAVTGKYLRIVWKIGSASDRRPFLV